MGSDPDEWRGNMNKNRISRSLAMVGILTLLAMASGCSSSGSLRSAYDDTSDFSQYTTYNFYSDAGPEHTSYQGMFSQSMVSAITLEMESRGYTKSDNPDLLVNFNARLDDKTKVTTSPSMNTGAYYGYRRGYYDPWGPSYGYAQETHVSQYTEGTFNIDLVDASKKKLVWEAVSVGKITEEKLANIQERVRIGVPEFFALYPFVAGDGTPRETGK